MKKTFFVAGTDTHVGKTCVATGLLIAARQQGLTTIGLKPVAAGADSYPDGWRNDDAVALQQAMTFDLPYEQINPILLKSATAPHIAAAQEKRQLSADRIAGFCRASLHQADFTVIEGAGGWRVPLNPRESMADVAIALRVPVILVVGVRLGCLNHALLTAEAIRHDGLLLAGWVANQVDPAMLNIAETIDALQARLPAPCLGVIPHMDIVTAEAIGEHLSIAPLVNTVQ